MTPNSMNIGTPYICPICNGKRVVSADFYPNDNLPEGSFPVCKSCLGMGVLWSGTSIATNNGTINPQLIKRLNMQKQKIADKIIEEN